MARNRDHSIIDYLDSSTREQLEGEYQFVSQPGPGVIRLRTAITEAKSGVVILDTISTVLPISLAISGIKRIATGTYGFTGQMGIEVELLDSQAKRSPASSTNSTNGGPCRAPATTGP